MNILAQIAQAAVEHQALYTYGPLGVICAWLMWRDEKRAKEQRDTEGQRAGDMRSLGHRIDGLTKALLVDMAERDSAGDHTRRYAREEIAKLTERERQ